MLPKPKICNQMHMIGFKDYGESGDELQDDVTTTKHLVTCNILFDNILQNKTSY